MSRKVDGWGYVGSVLARVLDLPPPSWQSEETREAAWKLLRGLRKDILALWSDRGVSGAAKALEVSRVTLHRWGQGWLIGRLEREDISSER